MNTSAASRPTSGKYLKSSERVRERERVQTSIKISAELGKPSADRGDDPGSVYLPSARREPPRKCRVAFAPVLAERQLFASPLLAFPFAGESATRCDDAERKSDKPRART